MTRPVAAVVARLRITLRDATAIGVATIVSIALGGAASMTQAHAAELPAFKQVRESHRPSDVQVLDRHGRVIQTMRIDKQVRRLPWVGLQEVSPAMRLAIVLSEDQRFWQHSGVDWQAAASSAWANLWNKRTRGASTVTMQLAGLLSQDDGAALLPQGRRSWPQKLGQAWTASRLEGQWRKSDILEAYLNMVPFRGELVGLPAMTQTLFHKQPSGLDAQEAAIAAALVRGPNASPALVARRACQVLALQRRSCQGIDLVTQTALAQKGGAMLGEQIAPHAARQLWLQAQARPGQVGMQARKPDVPGAVAVPPSLRSTLDARLQRLAVSLLSRHLSELSHREVEDGAVIVLDNASGEVLAWVGGSGALSDSPDVDAVLARRQPGSTLKPFVYEMAFEQRLLTPASLLHDAPVQLPTGAGLYIPQNYDKRFKGWVSVRAALGNSLNVPAVRAGAMLGPDLLAQRLNALGLALKEPGGYYGPGLALGSAEVTLRDLANAYRTLAYGGVWTPVRLAPDGRMPASGGRNLGTVQPSPRRVLDAAASYLVTDILADNTARALTFGLDSVLATRGFAAVKTGTSKDMRDNWCIGYTSRYTVGVWVGNASGSPMHDVSGVSGAAPIWAALVAELHRGRPSVAPGMPAGVVRQAIAFGRDVGGSRHGGVRPDSLTAGLGQAGPLDADRSEVFLAGTAQSRWDLASHGPGSGGQGAERAIRLPQDGAIFALDPDIPPRSQRIVMATDRPGAQWWLDGRKLSLSRQLQWAPWPGRHSLQLREANSKVLDEIQFEVRGANVRVVASSAGQHRPGAATLQP